MATKPKDQAAERPKQELPVEIVGDLMRAIRLQFCPDVGEKEWFKDNFHFIRRHVVLWPASFIYSKGFTLPPERFKAILFWILNDIKANGNTSNIGFLPAYLAKCVQSHFKTHWEEYYNEAKAIRNKVEAALFACRKSQEASRGADPVEAMAMRHRVLSAGTAKRRAAKPAAKTQSQMDLF